LTKNALDLLNDFKEVNPEGVYTTGGPLPTLYPSKFAEKFDFVFKGEAAKSFPDFCIDYFSADDKQAFLRNINPYEYPGIFGRRFKQIESPVAHLSEKELDEFPIPDRSGFNHRKYHENSLRYSGVKRASIMMTYGCPFSCDFCSKPIFGNVVRYRNPDRIFAEIRDILSRGYNSLWIADDLFTYNKEFLIRFCNRLISEKLKISWSCLSRVDGMTDEISELMKKAGCSKVYLGIESGNNEVLKLMNKKVDTQVVREGVDIFNRNNISTAGFFIVGYPGETIETIEQTFQFALSLNLNEISFNVPYPLPGSKLYERVSGITDDDWSFENETRFLYESEFDEKWLKRRIDETLEEFENMKIKLIVDYMK
jgi:anaerobic magnesium-protoporphyrin IX monomethyl ester cyclase